MKTTFKKIMAVMTAAAIAASLSGCMDKGYIMTVDGIDVRNGVYLSLQQTSIKTANAKVEEQETASGDENTSDTTSSSETSASSGTTSDTTSGAEEEKDIFESVIDGKSYSDWIIDDTKAAVKRFVGIQRECERLGITLTDEEKAEIKEEVDKLWEGLSSYEAYMSGCATDGEYFESQGISIDSYKELTTVDKLNEKLFLHYYDRGGEWAVSDEEFSKEANERFANYNLITLQYLDYKGDILITDEEKQEIKDLAASYADRLNNDDSLIDVMYDQDLLTARNKAKADAEKSYSEDKAEGLTKEEYIDKAVKAVSVEKKDDEKEFDEFISKKDSTHPEELTNFIFGLPLDGKAYVLEGTTAAYVVIRNSVTELENWETHFRTPILLDVKGDEFDSKMDIICQNYTVEQNDYLVNTKYSPKKIINKNK